MKHVNFSNKNCSLARSLEVLGEWWTLSILQEALFGTKRFGDFQKNLGIAKNILSVRLDHLVSNGLLKKDLINHQVRRPQYKLTEKGRSVATIIVSLIQWGDKWISSSQGPPIILNDIKTGKQIVPISLKSSVGDTVNIMDISIEAGPGSSKETKSRFSRKEYINKKIKWKVRDKD